MGEKLRKHIYVSGRVQGVGFRANTREKAQRIGVTGWVKNLYDGRVEVVVEGNEDSVNQMVKYLRNGPRFANVENIDINEEKPTDQFNTFSIKY